MLMRSVCTCSAIAAALFVADAQLHHADACGVKMMMKGKRAPRVASARKNKPIGAKDTGGRELVAAKTGRQRVDARTGPVGTTTQRAPVNAPRRTTVAAVKEEPKEERTETRPVERKPEKVAEQPAEKPVEVAAADTKPEKEKVVKHDKRNKASKRKAEEPVEVAAAEPAEKEEPVADSAASDASPIQVEIYFDLGSASVSSESELASVVEWLNAHPNGRLVVEGHTDPSGSPAINLKLSRRRAQAVKSYLVGQGGAAARIKVVAKGENNLAYGEDDPKNRRVFIQNR